MTFGDPLTPAVLLCYSRWEPLSTGIDLLTLTLSPEAYIPIPHAYIYRIRRIYRGGLSLEVEGGVGEGEVLVVIAVVLILLLLCPLRLRTMMTTAIVERGVLVRGTVAGAGAIHAIGVAVHHPITTAADVVAAATPAVP